MVIFYSYVSLPVGNLICCYQLTNSIPSLLRATLFGSLELHHHHSLSRTVAVSNCGCGPRNLAQGNPETYWRLVGNGGSIQSIITITIIINHAWPILSFPTKHQ